jgi:hypothetical protein
LVYGVWTFKPATCIHCQNESLMNERVDRTVEILSAQSNCALVGVSLERKCGKIKGIYWVERKCPNKLSGAGINSMTLTLSVAVLIPCL